MASKQQSESKASLENSSSAPLIAAAAHLAAGYTVAIPTETVYGLAGRIDRPQAIDAIFRLKKRPTFDPLIVHIADRLQLKTVVTAWPDVADALADALWPGPLTLILPKHPSLNPAITSGLETVGVRQPRHPLTLALLSTSGPLAAPSANRFGHTSPTRAEHVRDEFATAVASGEMRILDGGPAEVGVESTVARLVFDANGVVRQIEILRPGGITEDQISRALHSRFPEIKVTAAMPNDRRSPGHLEHHYMPVKPLVWLSTPRGVGGAPDAHSRRPDAVGGAPDDLGAVALALGLQPNARSVRIQLHADAALAARELYHRLREADHTEADFILIELPESQQSDPDGLWVAIADRIKRAARFQWPLLTGLSNPKK